MLSTKILGEKYENLAIYHLKQQKYKILDRNFSCPVGEIDIIAKDKDGYVVFIEVKYRATAMFGRPAEAVTPNKIRHIRNTAQVYLKSHGLLGRNIRFDIIEIIDEEIRHIKNAF